VSGVLAPFPALPASFDLSVRVGAAAPHVVTLTSTPGSLEEAATAVQNAIRSATDAPGFAGVDVAATDRQLILVAADRTTSIQVAAGTLADALKLSAGSSNRDVYLSGSLRPFPTLTNSAAQVRVRIGGTTADATLAAGPRSLNDAASALESAIRNASGVAGFTNARVSVLGAQLCILAGSAAAVTITAVPNVDETTAGELQLAAAYLVRASVRGVESIDQSTVDLP
jgi:hypothetical protein